MISSKSLQFIITWDLSNYQQKRTTGNNEVFGRPILSQVTCHETASTTYGKISMFPMLATITMTTICQSKMITKIYLMIFWSCWMQRWWEWWNGRRHWMDCRQYPWPGYRSIYWNKRCGGRQSISIQWCRGPDLVPQGWAFSWPCEYCFKRSCW